MTRRRLLILSCLMMAAVAWPAAARAQRTMTIVDLIDLPYLSSPQLSPDGRQMLYVQSFADWDANKRVTHIWRVNRDGTG